MKDPLDNRKRAYEILDISQNASVAEINAAFARLIANDRSRLQELNIAWNKLRKAETRLEEDFWYYDLGQSDKIEGTITGVHEELSLDPILPPEASNINLKCIDLSEERYRNDFAPIEFREFKLSDIITYNEVSMYIPPLNFDK
jgi:hypothetical protein